MPKTIKEITIEDIQDLVDDIIYSRGEEYFESDCVENIEVIDSSTLTGTVRGNYEYSVTITIDDDDISCECSCPCDFNCKHATALLLKWLSIKKEYDSEFKEAKPQGKDSIADILSKKSKEELIELFSVFLHKHPEMKSLIKIEKKEITSKIKNLFSKFWNWNEIHELISQLETILEGVKRNKGSWDKGLLCEMETCSKIMIEGQNNVHDEGDLGLFLEDWFLLYGEIFCSLNPAVQEKKDFLQKIINFIKEDDYGFDSSYEKAFIGMCSSKEDILLIQEYYKSSQSNDEEDYEDLENNYKQFYLKLYDKLGMNTEYLTIAKESGYSIDVIDKLISLEQYEEALKECKKAKNKENSCEIEQRMIKLMHKLGKKQELKKLLYDLSIRLGHLEFILLLKKEVEPKEWKEYLKKLISDSKKKGRNNLLSKIYFHEKEYKNAFEYSHAINDINYLELLAKKLSEEYPLLACEIFRKLCFSWIDSGSGWPYKKAGKMLEAIKKLDKTRIVFTKIKDEIISKHKKKYSLMEIIENV